MSNVANTMTGQRHHFTMFDRTATLASWALAGALFLTVGWLTMAPDDPLGAVSFLTRDNALMMIVQLAALAGVVSALATVIAGRRLTDVGTFAVAIGLALVSLRGGTAEYLLLEGADASGASPPPMYIGATFERSLAVRFAVEAVGWFVVIAVAVLVACVVQHWCFGSSEDPDPSAGGAPRGEAPTLAGYDIPRLSANWLAVSPDRQTAPMEGVKHTLTVVAVTLAAMAVLSFGLSSRSIRHGQTCFVVAASVCIAVYVAYRSIPVCSVLWSILAVAVTAMVGYGWALLRPTVASLPPNVPSCHFLRILPIQFISVGTAAAIATLWYVYTPPSAPSASRQSHSQISQAKGRR